MKRYKGFIVGVLVVGAFSAFTEGCSGGGATTAQQAAQQLCAKVCECSSTCTVATADPSGAPKEPVNFGTVGACQAFYATFLDPDGATHPDPSACNAAVASATCLPDSTGHFLVPPDACRGGSVSTSDGGVD